MIKKWLTIFIGEVFLIETLLFSGGQPLLYGENARGTRCAAAQSAAANTTLQILSGLSDWQHEQERFAITVDLATLLMAWIGESSLPVNAQSLIEHPRVQDTALNFVINDTLFELRQTHPGETVPRGQTTARYGDRNITWNTRSLAPGEEAATAILAHYATSPIALSTLWERLQEAGYLGEASPMDALVHDTTSSLLEIARDAAEAASDRGEKEPQLAEPDPQAYDAGYRKALSRLGRLLGIKTVQGKRSTSTRPLPKINQDSSIETIKRYFEIRCDSDHYVKTLEQMIASRDWGDTDMRLVWLGFYNDFIAYSNKDYEQLMSQATNGNIIKNVLEASKTRNFWLIGQAFARSNFYYLYTMTGVDRIAHCYAPDTMDVLGTKKYHLAAASVNKYHALLAGAGDYDARAQAADKIRRINRSQTPGKTRARAAVKVVIRALVMLAITTVITALPGIGTIGLPLILKSASPFFAGLISAFSIQGLLRNLIITLMYSGPRIFFQSVNRERERTMREKIKQEVPDIESLLDHPLFDSGTGKGLTLFNPETGTVALSLFSDEKKEDRSEFETFLSELAEKDPVKALKVMEIIDTSLDSFGSMELAIAGTIAGQVSENEIFAARTVLHYYRREVLTSAQEAEKLQDPAAWQEISDAARAWSPDGDKVTLLKVKRFRIEIDTVYLDALGSASFRNQWWAAYWSTFLSSALVGGLNASIANAVTGGLAAQLNVGALMRGFSNIITDTRRLSSGVVAAPLPQTAIPEVARYDTPGDARSVDFIGGYTFVADGSGGLLILDDNLGYVTTVPTVGDARSVCVHETHEPPLALVTAGTTLQIFDISNPANPTEIGWYAVPEQMNYVSAAGNYAVVTKGLNENQGYLVIDISTPQTPAELFSTSTAGTPLSVDFDDAGRYAYLTVGSAPSWGSGLHIVDVSSLSGNFVPTSGLITLDVDVSGNFLLVADGDAGVEVNDLTIMDPLHPVPVHSYPGPENALATACYRHSTYDLAGFQTGDGSGILYAYPYGIFTQDPAGTYATGNTIMDINVPPGSNYAFITDLDGVKKLDLRALAPPTPVPTETPTPVPLPTQPPPITVNPPTWTPTHTPVPPPSAIPTTTPMPTETPTATPMLILPTDTSVPPTEAPIATPMPVLPTDTMVPATPVPADTLQPPEVPSEQPTETLTPIVIPSSTPWPTVSSTPSETLPPPSTPVSTPSPETDVQVPSYCISASPALFIGAAALAATHPFARVVREFPVKRLLERLHSAL